MRRSYRNSNDTKAALYFIVHVLHQVVHSYHRDCENGQIYVANKFHICVVEHVTSRFDSGAPVAFSFWLCSYPDRGRK